jgi:uncharacterized protein (DUF433 family)
VDRIDGAIRFLLWDRLDSIISFPKDAAFRRKRRRRQNQGFSVRINLQVCHGRPCIKGTRVMVSVVLANLGERETHEAIMRNYHVTSEDIQAAILFAADMADDQHLPIEHGSA